MLTMFLPMAVSRVQLKIEEEEKKYEGNLLFRLTNEAYNGDLNCTTITTFGYKKGQAPETIGKIGLKEAVANQEMLKTGLEEVQTALKSYGLDSLVKDQMDKLTPETIAEFIGKAGDYLSEVGRKEGGQAMLNMQVTKGKPWVQVAVRGEGHEHKNVETLTLEGFAKRMLETYAA